MRAIGIETFGPPRKEGEIGFDWNAFCAAQYATMIQCLYGNLPDGILQVARWGGATADLVVFNFNKDVPTPSWALLRTGQRFHILVAGTSNVGQWKDHFRGSGGRLYHNHPQIVAHYFDVHSRLIWANVLLALPPDADPWSLIVSGHSYGAGIAHLIGNLANLDRPNHHCTVISLGSPRVLTDGYDGPSPNEHWRIAHDADAVTASPPRYTSLIAPRTDGQALPFHMDLWDVMSKRSVRGWLNWKTLTTSWEHYGQGITLNRQGGFFAAQQETWDGLRLRHLAPDAGALASHLIPESYFPSLMTVHGRAHKGIDQKALDLGTVFQVAADQPDSTPNLVLSPQDYMDEDTVRTILLSLGVPYESLLAFGALPAASLTSLGVAASTSNGGFFSGGGAMASTFKVTLHICNDQWGKRQSFGIVADGVPEAFEAGKRLATLRAFLLGRDSLTSPSGANASPFGRGTPCVEFISVIDALNPRQGQMFNVPRDNGNPSGGLFEGSGADPLWIDLTLPLYGTSGTARRRHQLKIVGMPDACVKAGRYLDTVAFLNNTPLGFNDRLKAFILALANGPDTWGLIGHNPAVLPKAITSWDVTADGELTALFGVAHGFTDDQRVRIKGTGSRYANRVWYVRFIDATHIALKKSQRTGLGVPGLGGDATLYATKEGVRQVVLYPFTDIPNASTYNPSSSITVSKTKPGRRSSRVSFGRRGRLNS